jgi:hypothetical protein
MNALAALQFATTVLQTLPSLIAAGAQVGGLLQTTNEALARMQSENRGPSDAEWEAINSLISELRSSLRA